MLVHPRWCALACCLLLTAQALAQPCEPLFRPGFDNGSLYEWPNSTSSGVLCATYFPSAGQSTLFVGGSLQTPHDGTVYAAWFNGSRWVGIPGFNAPVRSMTTFDFGNGPELVVGGSFTVIPGGQAAGGIARWDGAQWHRLGAGVDATSTQGIFTLLATPSAGGTSLYAGGLFTRVAGSTVASRVLRWDGSEWIPVGTSPFLRPFGLNGDVRTLAWFDDGDGPRLFAGGRFQTVGGQPAVGVVAWSGSAWTAVGDLQGDTTEVHTMAVHAGSLYLGGRLAGTTSGLAAVVRLNGQQWIAVPNANNGLACSALLSTNADLYAAVGTTTAKAITRLEDGAFGIAGPPVSGGHSTIHTIAPTPAGAPLILGAFTAVGQTPAACAAVLEPSGWSPIEPVSSRGDPGFGVLSFGPGADAVYIGDQKYTPAGPATFDLPAVPRALATLSQPAPARLVLAASSSSLWADSGSGWSITSSLPGSIGGLWVATDTGTESLLAERQFSFLIRLTDSGWQDVGPRIAQQDALEPAVIDVETCDHGSGPRLYLAALTGVSPSQDQRTLLVLDSGQWLTIPTPGPVAAIAVHDFGEGPELAVACAYRAPFTGGVLRWNGSRLLDTGFTGVPAALAVMDLGFGPRLFASGGAAPRLKFWTGHAWSPVPGFDVGMGPTAMAPVRQPDGRYSLFITGSFTTAGDTISTHVAQFVTCPPSCTPDFDNDGDSATDADIEAFFACLAGNCCPTCGTADFNNDGDPATDADIESFFRVLAGGPC